MRRRAKQIIAITAVVWLLVALGAVPAAAVHITIDFDDAPVEQIYETLAAMAGLNVLLDASVEGKASFALGNIDPMDAVDLVSSVLGHGYILRHGTLIVATRQRLDEISSQALAYHRLQYASADEARAALAMVLPSEQIFIDGNLVILSGTEKTLQDAERILAEVDRPRDEPRALGSTDVLSLLEDIVLELGLDLVADPGLADRRVVATWTRGQAADVLEVVSELLDLYVQRRDGTLFVSSSPPTAAAEHREQVKIYNLNYADPELAERALSMVVPSESIRADVLNHRIMVRGSPQQLEEVDLLLWDLDVPQPQVIMEVYVHEMSTNALRDLGIEWKGVPSFEGYSSFGDGINFFEIIWQPWELVLALRVLEQRGEAKILANPKIATISGQEASIFVGDRVPIIETTDEGTRLIEYIQAGIDLSVTPRISGDGYITIQVRPEVSTFVTRAGFPEVRTREAETTVRVRDGQPIMIGGLLQEEELEELRRIPLLADLPILGRLFEWRNTETRRTEMNIFLIPRIVDGTEGMVTQDFFIPTQ